MLDSFDSMRLILLTLTLLTLSCNSEVSKEQLFGKYRIENELSYTEIWFDSGYLLHWNGDFMSYGIYKYEVDEQRRILYGFTPPRLDTAIQLRIEKLTNKQIRLSEGKSVWTFESFDKEPLKIDLNSELYFQELYNRTMNFNTRANKH